MRPLLVGLLLAVTVFPAPAAASKRSDATRYLRLERTEERRMEAASKIPSQELEALFEECVPKDVPDAAAEDAAKRTFSLGVANAYAMVAEDIRRSAERRERFTSRTGSAQRAARAVAVIYRSLIAVSSRIDPCAYFEAWRAAGWSADFRIDPPAPVLTEEQRTEFRRALRTVRRSIRTFRRYRVRRALLRDYADNFRGVGDLLNLAPL